MSKKRFILVRRGKMEESTQVTIHDTNELVPNIINGHPTRTYKCASEVMDYLDAYPIMKRLNTENSKETSNE